MNKDSFLDTNVIVNYANYKEGISKEIVGKCYRYIKNKSGRFIVCFAVMRELENIIVKFSNIYKAVLKKLEDSDYSLAESKYLAKRDMPFAEKLYVAFKDKEFNKTKEMFAIERDIFEIEIERFLKSNVDLKVIPLEQIKIELVNTIYDIIDNYADCQIIASALQYRKEIKEGFLFVTADKKDLNPNGYDYLKDYGMLKNYEFPELHNLMFIK